MSASVLTRLGLSTGVELTVELSGPEEAPPIIFLHGFPESHRTWRKIIPALAGDFRCIAPDQRGYAKSSKPEGVDAYRVDCIVQDVLALADALKIDRFTLVGHDWGGAAAWAAALKHPKQIARLIVLNAPHPYTFQRTLIEDRDQRAASQYIRAFRNPGLEVAIKAMGLETFFDKSFGDHADLSKITPEDHRAYIDEWSQPGALTGMLNWYRATDIVVPETDEKAGVPLWLHLPIPHVKVPTLVVWGMRDHALLPIQLEGLDKYVNDLRIVPVPDAGHFLTWERPDPVVAAMRDFLL